jgi:predicted transcriptional regulator
MNGNGTTLELDAATASVLDHLAQTWGVSKEEAVRRAVAEANVATAESAKLHRVEAFKELQRRLQLTPEKAVAWQAAVRDARR